MRGPDLAATVVIPARYGSTRFPAKMLAADTGKPLVQHVVERVRQAKRVRNVELAVIPLRSEPGVKFDYEIAMGVRQGEGEWKATVDKLIAENQAAITAILREYNVPLVDARGEPIN